MLPISNQPEQFFILYFSNLFDKNDLTKKVALVTSGNRNPLLTYDSGFKYFFTGNLEAISISKTLAPNPTTIRNIPTDIIPPNVILSRQLIGTDFTLSMVTFFNLTPLETIVFKGQIGRVTQRTMSVDIELISKSAKLSTTAKLKTSSGCMNNLGDGFGNSIGKCTVDKKPVTVVCTGIVGTSNLSLGSGFTLDNTKRYEVIVGTTSYLIDELNSTSVSLRVVGLLQGAPQKVTIQLHCNKAISTCSTVYSNIAQFNGVVLLKADSLVINA
jgi:hypothetical protein